MVGQSPKRGVEHLHFRDLLAGHGHAKRRACATLASSAAPLPDVLRQRIAIATALISNPKLIILDEPVSALDVSIRSQIMNLFKDIQEEFGVSYLLVAHDLATTRYLADAVAVMYLGRIVEYGPSEEIFSNPQHPYTQALFSAALPSEPGRQNDEIILEGEMPSPLNPPSGCPFHPRCHRKIGAICEDERPSYHAVGQSTFAACHLLHSNGIAAPDAANC
ncbi:MULTISPECIES: oligopeptide/dipeptide ABC transporter ATP-binding protein [Devosia]|uniref:oligopeptide/dipeptide ABC transporter ATP-binding protein n=1 Tax=Devosia TaxID=46913 RepID=UPI001FE5D07A|nr:MULTISPECIES: oligopeptide/dipeptide ABC transporter ATP-binding protein [Devosia]